MVGVAGVGVAASYTSVMLEVDGVSRPVTSWGNTVGDALEVAGVSIGSNDLVQPGEGEAVRDGDTIIVRTSKAYAVTVDGTSRTLWTTASSADAILADAAPLGSAVTLAADRSSSRDELTPSFLALATSLWRWMAPAARWLRGPARMRERSSRQRGCRCILSIA